VTTTQEIQPGRRIDLTREVIGVDRADRRARLVDQVAGRPPQRIDGFMIGAPQIAGDPPHDGEMHPDGDELLYLVSGAVTVTLELPGGDTRVDLGAGDAIVVPQGVWHQITTRERARLIHITPGPNGDARPRRTGRQP
jgi:mannose-6-phosphate isomerase-like protein (cupin superfamily)